MAKNKVSEWSSTPANNTDIANIDIAEGCAPSGVNNAIREMMAQVKDMQSGYDGDDFTVGGDLYVADDATIADTLVVQNATIINGTLRTDGLHYALGGVQGNLTGNVTGNVSGTSANVTGTVAVANGGTGLTTLTSGNVILGNGTSTPTFVSPSTAGNVLTSNGTTWVSGTAGLGFGQTWQNVKSSRAANTSYTNSTGKPIMVSVFAAAGATTSPMKLIVDGIQVSGFYLSLSDEAVGGSVSGIIPNGSTYEVTITGGLSIDSWAELR